MSAVLYLPACPTNELPPTLQDGYRLPWDQVMSHPLTIRQQFQDLAQQQQFKWILGTSETPSLAWINALSHFPEAQVLCYAAPEWVNPQTGEVFNQDATTKPVDEEEQSTPLQQPETTGTVITPAEVTTPPVVEKETPPQVDTTSATTVHTRTTSSKPLADNITAEETTTKSVHHKTLSDKQLIFEIFKQTSWDPNNSSAVLALERELKQRSNPLLLEQLAKAKKDGRTAHLLGQQIVAKIEAGENEEKIAIWLGKVQPFPSRVRRSVEIMRDKHLAFLNKKAQQNKGYHSTLPPVVLENGIHPNAIAHLAQAASWEILIDETGDQFDREQLRTVGREGKLVALAIPANQKKHLPALSSWHAVDKSTAEIDRVLDMLLHAKVGIFGFTIQDRDAGDNDWLSHVLKLAKWTLYQLPLTTQPQVKILIEQRGGDHDSATLQVVERLLLQELKALDGERFQHLGLELSFIDNNAHPHNGYVDAVAYTWGSGAADSRDRLKKSRLEGHCLLRPCDENNIERLYLAINREHDLSPKEWYAMVSAVSELPPSSLLHAVLEKVGGVLQQDHECTLWPRYFEVVKQQLRQKNYRPKQLQLALSWLQRYAPSNHNLPPLLQLHLGSAMLAANNHTGHVKPEHLDQMCNLAMSLYEEDAREACEVILRAVIQVTNAFQFTDTQSIIEHWLKKPVAAIGISNHGKLYSTLGQLAAFQGNTAQALEQFDLALATFDKLSDPKQRQREQQQTMLYRLVAEMDQVDLDVEDYLLRFTKHLETVLQKRGINEVARSITASEQKKRFEHYLFLRACWMFPHQMQSAISDYVKCRHQWQVGEGHPWMLIQAYRGGLTLRQGDTHNTYFAEAITMCREQEGVTLRWMGEVLALWYGTLNGRYGTEVDTQTMADLAQQLPDAPHGVFKEWKNTAHHIQEPEPIVSYLQRCLPFNFH